MSEREFNPSGDVAMRPESVGLVWPRAPRPYEMTDTGICVISINGPLEHKGSMWSWFESYERILSCFEGAMRSDEVKGIILKIDSPGGEVSGLNETVKRMRAIKEECGKPVITYADDEAYSAAYAIATVGDEIYLSLQLSAIALKPPSRPGLG